MLLSILLPSVLFVVAVSVTLLMCLKIKSSKKDPAFSGTEGTICPIGDLKGSVELHPTHLTSTPSPCNASSRNKSAEVNNVSSSSNRTPSRSGERKLPEIPRDDSSQSDLYATLDGGSDPEYSTGVAGMSQAVDHHPYAKVLKKSKLEHPYATVKKATAPQDPGTSSKGYHQAEHRAKELSYPSSSSSSSSSNDDEETTHKILHRLEGSSRGGSRAGSGRSSSRHLAPASSSHSVNSRQATPLPSEPTVMQNPNMHFSGDSQDSSKGYTSITVREPVRHIQLQRPTDTTYATVSEASDDMYAAIEDPTYIPTGAASQSNSDTYAVIDLPEERSEVDMSPLPEKQPSYHPYSRVDKSKKQRGGQQMPPPPTDHRRSFNMEDMYAKVRKRSSMENASDAAVDLEELPVGASAMHTSLDLLSDRSRIRSMDWTVHDGDRRGHRNRSEINYSDYEVSLYDKGKGKAVVAAASDKEEFESGYEIMPESQWKKKRLDSSNGGYETVPPAAEPNYEILPDYWRSSNSGGGYETVRERESSREPGYEVVRGATGGARLRDYDSVDRKEYRDPGYESVEKPKDPPYAKLSNMDDNGSDSEMGYETIPGMASYSRGGNIQQHHRGDYDPGYEILSRPTVAAAVSESGYETVVSKQDAQQQQQQQLVHMSVLHDQMPPTTDTPLLQHQRRPSVVLVEHIGVSEVDTQQHSSAEINRHIYV